MPPLFNQKPDSWKVLVVFAPLVFPAAHLPKDP